MAKSSNLSQLGEFGFIGRISSQASAGCGVLTGIGDDAAVTALTEGTQLLTSTDMLLEGVHFRRKWHDAYSLGRKSLAVNLSDIAAMGGVPRWCTLSLAIPADAELEFLDQFTSGFLEIANEHEVCLIGGDTCSSKSGFVISVTIMGEQLPQRIIRRSGAKPGDDIWVTGTLGDAALGLKLLENDLLQLSPDDEQDQSWVEAVSYLCSRLLDPAPRSALALALAESGMINSMIDVSDGMLADFAHIAELSAVGGNIILDKIPVSDEFRVVVSKLRLPSANLVLSGGEDYELAFTAAPCDREKIHELVKKSGVTAVPVGIVTPLRELQVIQGDGTFYTPKKQGFNHFK